MRLGAIYAVETHKIPPALAILKKMKKRNIRFLRQAAKSDNGVKKMGRSKQRKSAEDLVVEPVEKVTSLNSMTTSLDQGALSNDEEDVETQKVGLVGRYVSRSLTASLSCSTNELVFRRHRAELGALEKQDPEFFKFLQENDANLLDFNDSEDEDLESESDDEETEPTDLDHLDIDGGLEVPESIETGTSRELKEATSELLRDTVSGATKGSYSALKRLMTLFRAACIPANADDMDAATQRNTSSRYTVSTPEIYNAVMIKTMEGAYKAFYNQLGLKQGKISADQLKLLEDDPRLKKVQPLILSFYKSIMHSLDSLASTDQAREVVVYLVSGLEPYVPLLAPMPRLAKSVLKVLLKLWSGGPSPAEDPTHARGHCFLRIRQFCVVLPGTLPEECFKSIYMTFARNCKSYNELTEPSVTFMAQCIAELYKLDPVLAYQQGFLYIRQLALHLRVAYIKKTTETTRPVLSWQYLNCLRLWTRVVCSMPGPDDLGQLVFPLAQIMQGVLSVAVSSVYLPLRFHVMASLQQLAANAEVFIPLAPKIREIFELTEMLSNPKHSTEVAPRLQYLVKISAEDILKPAVRDCIIEEAIQLLRQESEIYRYHVGVPEYLYMTTRKVRHFLKQCKVGKWRDLGKTLINQNESYSSFTKKERLRIGKPPMDIVEFEAVKPAKEPKAAIRLTKLMSSRMSTAKNDDEIIIGSESTATREVQEPSVESWRQASVRSNAQKEDSDSDSEEEIQETKQEKGKKRKSESEPESKRQKLTKKLKTKKRVSEEGFPSKDGFLPEDNVKEFVWSDED